MTPFESGINALLGFEEQLCVRMHQSPEPGDRSQAYHQAHAVRACINKFAKAFLSEDDYKKFCDKIGEMHRTVEMRSFNINLTSEGG